MKEPVAAAAGAPEVGAGAGAGLVVATAASAGRVGEGVSAAGVAAGAGAVLPAEGLLAPAVDVLGMTTAGMAADCAERRPTEYPKPKKQAQIRARTKKMPRMVPGPRE